MLRSLFVGVIECCRLTYPLAESLCYIFNRCNVGMIRLLLALGVDTEARDAADCTALDRARQRCEHGRRQNHSILKRFPAAASLHVLESWKKKSSRTTRGAAAGAAGVAGAGVAGAAAGALEPEPEGPESSCVELAARVVREGVNARAVLEEMMAHDSAAAAAGGRVRARARQRQLRGSRAPPQSEPEPEPEPEHGVLVGT